MSVAIAGALPVLAFLAIPAVEQVEDLAVVETEQKVELCLADDDVNGGPALMDESGTSFGFSQVAALALFLLWKLMMGVAINILCYATSCHIITHYTISCPYHISYTT